MTQSTNEKMAALARELVAAAMERHVTLRVLGGVAVFMTCPSIETHTPLQRTAKDLDFVAAASDFEELSALLTARGLARHNQGPACLSFDGGGFEIEIAVPHFRHEHAIDLTDRLALASPTLPLADLLLIKLQRPSLVEKDIQDTIALLVDHEVVTGDEEDKIDPQYIARLCARDWGLFTAVYDNTVKLESVFDRYLEPQEAQLAWQRVELIQGEMDRQPKSLVWMLHQILRRPTSVPA